MAELIQPRDSAHLAEIVGAAFPSSHRYDPDGLLRLIDWLAGDGFNAAQAAINRAYDRADGMDDLTALIEAEENRLEKWEQGLAAYRAMVATDPQMVGDVLIYGVDRASGERRLPYMMTYTNVIEAVKGAERFADSFSANVLGNLADALKTTVGDAIASAVKITKDATTFGLGTKIAIAAGIYLLLRGRR